jgi:hypothetical protein
MYFVCGEMQGNAEAACWQHAGRFPNRHLPNRQTFQSVHRLLREHGTFHPQRVIAGHRRTAGLEECILHTVEMLPNISAHRTASTVGVSHTSVWRTLWEQLLHPYHFQWVQTLQPADALCDIIFVNGCCISLHLILFLPLVYCLQMRCALHEAGYWMYTMHTHGLTKTHDKREICATSINFQSASGQAL